MRYIFIAIMLSFVTFPALARDCTNIIDFYERLDCQNDEDEADTQSRRERAYKSPFDTPKESKDDRHKNLFDSPTRNDMHNNMRPDAKGTSSEEVLRKMLSPR